MPTEILWIFAITILATLFTQHIYIHRLLNGENKKCFESRKKNLLKLLLLLFASNTATDLD